MIVARGILSLASSIVAFREDDHSRYWRKFDSKYPVVFLNPHNIRGNPIGITPGNTLQPLAIPSQHIGGGFLRYIDLGA